MSHQMCNFASGHPRDMVLISNNRFLGKGNHLGPFTEASDRPKGQELVGGAVGAECESNDYKISTWAYI
jgi:hypothetical protein